MKSNLLNQDPNYDEWCEEEFLKSFRDSANMDDFLFGDYDYAKDWFHQDTKLNNLNVENS